MPPEGHFEQKRSLRRYGAAVGIVLAATLLRLVLLPDLGTGYAFITFYPALMLAALYGGLRAGLLATFLSAAMADYFWMEPAGTFAMANPIDWLALCDFCRQRPAAVVGRRKVSSVQNPAAAGRGFPAGRTGTPGGGAHDRTDQ